MATPYAELDVGLPAVLLPVRLETRYFAVNADLVELRVRIFPSRLHVTVDRPGIDPIERDQTVAYWRTRHAAGDDALDTETAWNRLVQLFGDVRAQYLRRLLTPTVAGGTLTFPDVPIADPNDDAVLAAAASGLPTRFFVAGYQGDQQVFRTGGSEVPAEVAVGPSGDDAAIRWQTDFAAAEAIGLGIRQQLPIPTAAALTRLVAFGVREADAAATGSAALERLLTVHAQRDGVALLDPGTPTNNTAATRTPTATPATGDAPTDGSERARLATALGLAGDVFAPVSGGDDVTEPAIAAMHAAMWQVTFQYFFDSMQSQQADRNLVDRARALYASSVRPDGPLRTLLVGNQPYGVLPVSPLARWAADGGAADPLVDSLRSMVPTWRTAAGSVPRLDGTGDIGAQLNAVLAQSPRSVRWLTRHARSILIAPALMATADHQAVATALVMARRRDDDGIPDVPDPPDPEPDPRPPRPRPPHRVIFADEVLQLTLPLVAAAEADRNAALPTNYLQAIAAAEVQALRDGTIDGAAPPSLLYMLMRHATLLVMTHTTVLVDPTLTGTVRADPVFVEDPSSTAFQLMKRPVAALGNQTLEQAIAGQSLLPIPALAELAEHRAALGVLAAQPVGVLERLTNGAIDAASYRVDAWVTALATERLAAMRTARPAGCHLGAYAWVDAPPVPSVVPRDGDPVTVDPDSEGFIHAPRLEQARTAAVLRGAFLARLREGAEAPFAVDLSSDRVADAMALMDGVRNGASLGALLGERIERWLIDAGFGDRLPDMRADMPLMDGSGRQRLDGVHAAQHWEFGAPSDLGDIPARVNATIDAIGDLLLAESVHHQAGGNPARAQPALTALDSGVTMPSSLDVVATAADSAATTWRLVLPVAADAVDAWADGLLGNVGALTATVTNGTTTTTVSLADAGVTSADLRGAAAAGRGVLNTLAEHAGGGTAEPSAELAAALETANALQRLLRGARPLDAGDVAAGRDGVAALSSGSSQIEWLHDVAHVRPVVDALARLDLGERAKGGRLGLQFTATAPGAVTVSVGAMPPGDVAGLLLDGWNEATPGTTATTGVAIHYDAPRSRAPQAILVVSPPNPAAGWSIDDVEASITETAELARIRMVRPGAAAGALLPATYLADNTSGEVVSTNFNPVGVVMKMGPG